MGSVASTQVKAIDGNGRKGFAEPKRLLSGKKKSPQNTVDKLQETDVAAKSKNSNEELQDALKKIKKLEKQLSESESDKLDLQDRIQYLEETLASQNAAQDTDIDDAGICTETVQAKDQYITKLDQELKASLQEISKLKAQCKRKVKKLTSELMEMRQGVSIQQFELKDEIKQLAEENERLKDKKKSDLVGSTTEDMVTDGGRTNLILELSAQLSEQSEQISALQATAAEKNRIIEELKSSLESINGKIDIPNGDDSRLRKQNCKEKTSLHHKYDEQNLSLRNSSSGRENKIGHFTRTSELAPVEEDISDENYKWSSVSRDSGSAGSTKTKSIIKDKPRLQIQKEHLPSVINHLSSLSDSDSDWDVEGPSSKTHSAPDRFRARSVVSSVDTLTQGEAMDMRVRSSNSKLKKKSVLRNRADRVKPEWRGQSSDLLGPTLAFAETSELDIYRSGFDHSTKCFA